MLTIAPFLGDFGGGWVPRVSSFVRVGKPGFPAVFAAIGLFQRAAAATEHGLLNGSAHFTEPRSH
jgi:hypothetical protein